MLQNDFVENGYTLKAARVNVGLSQKEAAEKLGISEFTLINYELGKTYPDVPVLKRIEALYKVPYHKIIFLQFNYSLNVIAKGGKNMNQDTKDLVRLIRQTRDFDSRVVEDAMKEKPEVVKKIIAVLKEEEELTYGQAYGILLLTKQYLEFEANYLSPISSKKEAE